MQQINLLFIIMPNENHKCEKTNIHSYDSSVFIHQPGIVDNKKILGIMKQHQQILVCHYI